MAFASWRRASSTLLFTRDRRVRERSTEIRRLGLSWRGFAVRVEAFVIIKRFVKQCIYEIEHAGLAAEVKGEIQSAGFRYLAAEFQELGWNRAAEAVDRLFEVADEEQAAFVEAGAADLFDELDLEGVGVLKFVDEQKPQVGGEGVANGGLFGIGQQRVGERKLVVEIEDGKLQFARLVGVGDIGGEVE